MHELTHIIRLPRLACFYPSLQPERLLSYLRGDEQRRDVGESPMWLDRYYSLYVLEIRVLDLVNLFAKPFV